MEIQIQIRKRTRLINKGQFSSLFFIEKNSEGHMDVYEVCYIKNIDIYREIIIENFNEIEKRYCIQNNI